MSCFFFTSFAVADILQDNIKAIEKKDYSFKEVCLAMTGKEYPLITKASKTRLDCMKKEVDVGDFCLKAQAADPYLLRGYIEKNRVLCVSGKAVSLKYECKQRDSLCASATFACAHFKSLLAKRLALDQSYLILNTKSKKEISCFFRPQKINAL